MEIKVGDKVRVREDAPRVYLRRWDKAVEYDVYAVDGDAAAITYDYQEIAIPLKYLVKVEDEAKGPKFKVGDQVEELVSRKSGRVLGIEGDFVVVGSPYDKEKNYWHIDSVELVEPTEQTEVEGTDSNNLKKVAEEWANTVSDATKEYGDAMCKIYVEAHNEAYWTAYTADLAHDIAVKIVNKKMDNYSEEVAGYAVSVAKAVVENLKKK